MPVPVRDQKVTISKPAKSNRDAREERVTETPENAASDSTQGVSDSGQAISNAEPIAMGPPPSKLTPNRSSDDDSPLSSSADDHRIVEARQRIADAVKGLESLETEVNQFSGSRDDKVFLRLEHDLTNRILRLDAVSAAGAPNEAEIRAERKAAIKRLQQTLDILELKVMSD